MPFKEAFVDEHWFVCVVWVAYSHIVPYITRINLQCVEIDSCFKTIFYLCNSSPSVVSYLVENPLFFSQVDKYRPAKLICLYIPHSDMDICYKISSSVFPVLLGCGRSWPSTISYPLSHLVSFVFSPPLSHPVLPSIYTNLLARLLAVFLCTSYIILWVSHSSSSLFSSYVLWDSSGHNVLAHQYIWLQYRHPCFDICI